MILYHSRNGEMRFLKEVSSRRPLVLRWTDNEDCAQIMTAEAAGRMMDAVCRLVDKGTEPPGSYGLSGT